MALLLPSLLLETNLTPKKKKKGNNIKKILHRNSVSALWKKKSVAIVRYWLLFLQRLQLSRPHSCSKSDIQLEANKERSTALFILKAKYIKISITKR